MNKFSVNNTWSRKTYTQRDSREKMQVNEETEEERKKKVFREKRERESKFIFFFIFYIHNALGIIINEK